MTTPPGNGGKKANGSPVLSAAAQAVEAALSTRPSGLIVPESVADQLAAWPLVVDLLARERPRADARAPRVFELAFLMRTSALSKEGRAAGVIFAASTPVRDLVAQLKTAIARMEQIADCVEQGKPIPDRAPDATPEAGGQNPAA